MRSLQAELQNTLNELSSHDELACKMRRTMEVHRIFLKAIEKIYKKSTTLILSHINAVYVLIDKDTKQKELIIYADDSMIRADLDARQEFIKMAFFYEGEDIRTIRFIASRGSIKRRRPFMEKEDIFLNTPQYLVYFEQSHHQLNSSQQALVTKTAQHIDHPQVSQSFLKAMRSNLETHD